MIRRPPRSPLFPYPTLFQSQKTAVIFGLANKRSIAWAIAQKLQQAGWRLAITYQNERLALEAKDLRSEEHTSELQSLRHLVCRLLLEKKKKNITTSFLSTRP